MIFGKTYKQRKKETGMDKWDIIRADGTNCFIVVPARLEDGRQIW